MLNKEGDTVGAIVANIERIKQTENNLRKQYELYMTVCKAIENHVYSLGRWQGIEKFIMDKRVNRGINRAQKRAQIFKDNADYLYRWRINILYAQSTMLNRIRYLR